MPRSRTPRFRLVIFDLDLTLWECGSVWWCDSLTPPLRWDGARRIDAHGIEVRLFPPVPSLLKSLHLAGYRLGIASRTQAPDIARQLLRDFAIDSYFTDFEIYPGDKSRHFHALRKSSGIDFSEMIFFDDEARNVESVSRLGVTACLLDHGITPGILEAFLPLSPPSGRENESP
ncbi:magnesium-dependent phosphatase 1 [Haloferula luteola]|uniref:Magnesium-dependent phosphatase 1 n=1 Tax=Haloferula luteola TaxID=595692 RepID=A0A840VGW6_9BACT|nr:magnesium-dependent phosphatase-1 [Haloferula luteola]MBB5353069.1 magnesium-dependent phosphatase 1 [Haloferula luteola]